MNQPLSVQEFFFAIKDWPTPLFQAHELVRSEKALELGFDNLPTREQLGNLREFTKVVLLPLRKLWGAQLIVNSAFRSKQTNEAVGGDSHSYHLANNGAAADLATAGRSREGTIELWNELLNASQIPFNELVLYQNPHRIHIGWDLVKTKNVRELWVARASGGYKKFQAGVDDLV